MATVRQVAANRLNAQKSTGPTTQEGKEQSRKNALKHGLAGAGVVVPEADQEEVARRADEWRAGYLPATAEHEWLFSQVVVNSVRIDHAQRQERTLRAHFARRATVCWDDDRRLDAEVVALSLAKRPSMVSRKLRRTTQGCDWLLDRWRALGRVIDADREWTEAQRSLALDLLGTPVELRDENPGPPAALVAREVERIERLKTEALDDLDRAERAAAESDLEMEDPKPLALLRRYEAACQRRLQWAQRQLRSGRHAELPEPALDARPCPSQPRMPRSALPELPPPTDEEFRAYEEALFGKLMTAPPGTSRVADAIDARSLAAAPSPAPSPSPSPRLSDAALPPSRHLNRRQRRAAERLAGRNR
jgi:hypothetical protein